MERGGGCAFHRSCSLCARARAQVHTHTCTHTHTAALQCSTAQCSSAAAQCSVAAHIHKQMHVCTHAAMCAHAHTHVFVRGSVVVVGGGCAFHRSCILCARARDQVHRHTCTHTHTAAQRSGAVQRSSAHTCTHACVHTRGYVHCCVLLTQSGVAVSRVGQKRAPVLTFLEQKCPQRVPRADITSKKGPRADIFGENVRKADVLTLYFFGFFSTGPPC